MQLNECIYTHSQPKRDVDFEEEKKREMEIVVTSACLV